ncbi:MAG: DMT family transporter [Sandaracinus sp.]
MSDRRGRASGVLGVLIAACAWGSWSVFLRPTGLPGSVTAPLLFAGVGVLSIPWALRDPVQARWDRASVLLLLAYTASNATNVVTFFSAMSTTSVAVAVLTHSVAPVLVAVLAPRVDGTKAPRAVPAALVALAGLALVLEPWRPEAWQGEVALGAMLGLTSAFAYAACVFMLGRLVVRLGAARTLSLHSGLAALLVVPFAGRPLLDVESADLVPLAGAVVFPGVLAGLAFSHGLRVLGSARTAVLALLEPVVACAIGWALWGEPLGPLAILGGAMVVAAGAMVAGDRTPAA